MNLPVESAVLDAAALLEALPPAVASAIDLLQVSDETGSTQTDALAVAAPAQGCNVFLAGRQTAGQGRRGRRWVSPAGANIYLSVSRRFARNAPAMAGLSLAVGVSVAESLHALGFPQVRLKWPNDLMAGGAKLGGILVNLRTEGERCSAVIGLGLNVSMPGAAGAAIDQAWCDLASLADAPPSRLAVVAAVLSKLLPALEVFDAQGLAPTLPRWQPLDAMVGQSVQLVEGDTRHVGLCLGVAMDGALRLRLSDGRVRDFHGGEASLRPA